VRDWAVACLRVVRMGRQQGEGRKQPALSERVNRAKEWAANRFKKSKTGCHEGEGIMLRVIELCSAFGPPRPLTGSLSGLHLSSVNVEEYEVLGFGQGGNDP